MLIHRYKGEAMADSFSTRCCKLRMFGPINWPTIDHHTNWWDSWPSTSSWETTSSKITTTLSLISTLLSNSKSQVSRCTDQNLFNADRLSLISVKVLLRQGMLPSLEEEYFEVSRLPRHKAGMPLEDYLSNNNSRPSHRDIRSILRP